MFAVKLTEPDFAIYNCAHCGESGYAHPGSSSQTVDLRERERRREEAARREDEEKRQRSRAGLRIWEDRQPFASSPAQAYLRDGRCIGEWLDAFDLEASLGFHPSCPFEGGRLPCMLALVRSITTDEPQGVHRTALRLGPQPERLGRLSLGIMAGGAVKLSADADVTGGLLIGEGIETVLSASRHLQFRPGWSVLSRSGIAKFPVLSGIDCVTIAVDNDDSGDGQRSAMELVGRLVAAGVEAITTPPNRCKDFNDILRGRK